MARSLTVPCTARWPADPPGKRRGLPTKESVLKNKKDELDKIIATTEKEEKHFTKLSQEAREKVEPRLLHSYDRIRGNYRSDVLPANRKPYLRHQPVDLNLGHSPDQLVSPADPAIVVPALSHWPARGLHMQKLVELRFRHAVMPARGLDRPDFFLVYPLLQSRVADPQNLGSLAWKQKSGWFHIGLIDGSRRVKRS